MRQDLAAETDGVALVLDEEFAPVRCGDCAFERLVPFSCKGRGFKAAWHDGTPHLCFAPTELLKELAVRSTTAFMLSMPSSARSTPTAS
jgi:hypothetical protein